MKVKAIFASIMGSSIIERVYSPESRAILQEKLDFVTPLYNKKDMDQHKSEWKDVEFMFSSWGAPCLTEDELSRLFPKLKAFFYAAGSVQYFARPYLKKGIRVFTSNEAMSLSVIDFTAAQIFLANKGYFQAVYIYRTIGWEEAKKYCNYVPGNQGAAVGIIGAGRIGRGVIEKLKNSRLKIYVFDPFLGAGEAEKLGVKKTETLEELFSSSFIISNHLANNEKTRNMLRYQHFSLMHDYGIFINTGRGAQVDEDGLVKALNEKPTRTALLDVTWPEPVQPEHPFLEMNNVLLSPHIAGTINNEQIWLGEYIAEEFLGYINGSRLRSEVTIDMLETMA